MDPSDYMLLTPARYKELQRAEAKLEALEGFGVDNWQGYDDAMDYFIRHYDQEAA